MVLEVSNTGSQCASYGTGERFSHPAKAVWCDSDLGWSVSHFFFLPKLVPLRQLFDNHYTVGTGIGTLYQTENQIAAAALKEKPDSLLQMLWIETS